MIEAGQYITDGTVTWIVADVRDGTQVGDIKMSPILRKGYVKANGALLTDASVNYPRLVAFVEDNPSLLATDDTAWATNEGLYVYDDTNDTLRVPNLLNRVMQGGDSVEEKEAGLPNIIGGTQYSGALSRWQDLTTIKQAAFTMTPRNFYFNNMVEDASNTFHEREVTLTFNASDSNSIYGNSQTVQPPAITLIPQIKY